jgi:hypothetical protein
MSLRGARVAGLVVVALVVGSCGGDDGGQVDTGGDTSTSVLSTEPPATSTPVGPTVSVADAVGQPDGTVLTIEANVFQPDEGATVLCDAFGESYPPTCVGPTLGTDGLDIHALPGVQSTSGGDLVAPATWTEAPVPVTGTLTAGRLVVSS